jgi:hypothetical protein
MCMFGGKLMNMRENHVTVTNSCYTFEVIGSNADIYY